MTLPEDPSSAQIPFSGDQSGSIFAAPDVVLQSPTTAERVVDTQSGFLVVIKTVEERQCLFVKRRLGTPPTSSVFLTPDEAVKLSRILLASLPSGHVLSKQAQSILDSGSTYPDINRRHSRSAVRAVGKSASGLKLALTASLLLLVVVAGYAFEQQKALTARTPLPVTAPQSVVKESSAEAFAALSTKSVDQFVRRFVSLMLDFNPQTYRVSQIQVMAAMSPDLVDSYWHDTHFPLTLVELHKLQQGNTLMINRVVQTKIDSSTVEADVFGDLSNSHSKIASAIHLRLKIALDAGNELKVVMQKDLSGQGS